MCKLWAEVKKSASLNSLRHRKHPNVQKGCLCHSTSFYETVIHLSTASDKITLHLKNSPWWITVASNNCDKFQLQTSAETLVKYTVHMSCYHPPWSGTFINVLAKHTEHTATFKLHSGLSDTQNIHFWVEYLFKSPYRRQTFHLHRCHAGAL